jgi:hypothetical protein
LLDKPQYRSAEAAALVNRLMRHAKRWESCRKELA